MSYAEYRAFLITRILSLQHDEGWTLEDLIIRPINNLEMLYHAVTIPDDNGRR